MFNFEERSRYVDWDIGYIEISPGFQSDLGYVRTNSYRTIETFGTYKIYFANGWLERLRTFWEFDHRRAFGGALRHRQLLVGLGANLRGQTKLSVGYSTGAELYRGVYYRNIWHVEGLASKYFSEQVFVRASIKYGQQISRAQRELGREVEATVYAYLRPHDRLLIEPQYDYLKSTHHESDVRLYEGYILRAKSVYFFSRNLNVRLVAQYNDIYQTLNIDPMITYRVSPFTMVYLGSSYEYCDWLSHGSDPVRQIWHLNRRQFFIKLQYLAQL
jgi:hypothetical protein